MNKTTLILVGISLIIFFVLVIGCKCSSKTDEIAYSNTKPIKIASIKVPPPPVTREDRINGYVKEVCRGYRVSPELIQSIIYYESRYKEDARNNDCVGLMQINGRYQISRAKKLGVTDLTNPYENIQVGVDYFSDLLITYKDPALALMIYNSGTCRALSLYGKGEVSTYARKVLAREKQLKTRNSRG